IYSFPTVYVPTSLILLWLRLSFMLTKPTHSFMAPKSMSSEKKNIELKSKEKNNTDKLNLSGQIVRHLISY
uniref:hypothetical protein n=1 Tax=Segatella copri TaxID=165179 RepID=UPI0025E04258